MRYFVVADDGSKYGPAEVSLLNVWIEEGRLLPKMVLEEEGTHHRVAAASIEQLDFYVLEAPAPPSPTDLVPSEVAALVYDVSVTHESERADMFLSWAMVVVTLCLSGVKLMAGYIGAFTALLGIVAAWKAKDRGFEGASVALAMNVFGLLIWLLARLYFITR